MDRLAIGIGNLDRGDDAAGVLCARRLTRTRAKEAADCSNLIDDWHGEDDVVVIDAMRSGRPPGTVTRIDVESDDLAAHSFSSTHSFGIAETVELARALGRLPRRLTIIGIEAACFDHGASVSPEVAMAIDRVTAEIDEGMP